MFPWRACVPECLQHRLVLGSCLSDSCSSSTACHRVFGGSTKKDSASIPGVNVSWLHSLFNTHTIFLLLSMLKTQTILHSTISKIMSISFRLTKLTNRIWVNGQLSHLRCTSCFVIILPACVHRTGMTTIPVHMKRGRRENTHTQFWYKKYNNQAWCQDGKVHPQMCFWTELLKPGVFH